MKTSSGWEQISQAVVPDSDRLGEADTVVAITLLIYFQIHGETVWIAFAVLFMCLGDRISLLIFSVYILFKL